MANDRVVVTVQSSLAWAEIRSTRAEPPGGMTGKRSKTYVAALEQAQQLFTAAASVGVASSPLLLFYGLSQGGRAIAAAAKKVGNNDYRLSGHGIRAKALDGPIADIEVYGDNSPTGSFTRLSTILTSPTWDSSASVKLGDLWNTLPEGSHWPLQDPGGVVPLPAAVDTSSAVLPAVQVGSAVNLIVTRIPEAIMPAPQQQTPAPGLRAFLDNYPSLSGYTDIYAEGIQPYGEGGKVRVAYQSSNSGYHERVADALVHSTPYRFGKHYVFPAVGTNASSLRPIMTWWTVLYTLSMLARYHPEEWAKHIAIDSSKTAVPIEQLLSVALSAVPELILQTIYEVAQ